jgi:hypothetical protein
MCSIAAEYAKYSAKLISHEAATVSYPFENHFPTRVIIRNGDCSHGIRAGYSMMH